MQSKKYISFALATASVLSAVLVASSAYAATNNYQGRMGGKGGMPPGVFGTVSAINGDSITVNSKGFGKTATATTYTVDATNATVTKSGAASSVSAIAVGDNVMVQGTVSGTSVTATKINDGIMMGGARGGMGMGVVGTVASVNGNTLTVTSKGRPNGSTPATPVTYTVDATNATVTKSGAASSVSAIAVGDNVMVQGTVSGTSVTATKINDGMMQSQMQGNGQPVVGGKITAISGTTITITNASNVTYTVDASSAKFTVKGITTPTISNVAVGDSVVVQGTVNGNSVTASTIMDQKVTTQGSSNSASTGGMMGGFVGGITNFFKHLFGF